MKKYEFLGAEYILEKDEGNIFDYDDIKERITDYFLPFDYIFGDLSYNKIRVYVGGQVYSTSDTKETINKNAMIITVNEDNTVTMSPYSTEGGLKVTTLVPSDNPNDTSGSYGYRNVYNPDEQCFYLYYSYDIGNGEQIIREQMILE